MAFSRRSFVQAAVAGTAGSLAAGGLSGCASTTGIADFTASQKNGQLIEHARSIPVREEDDVIVCGAGPAGVCAALAAARTGARARLLEVNGCLGGVWTAGLLTWIFDFDKPGLPQQISQLLEKRGARRGTQRSMFAYDPEEMKVLLEEQCSDAGIKIRLRTRVVAAHLEKGHVAAVVTESSSGREAWRAPVFIDATGDGDLGALAGCRWDIGEPGTGNCQPLTLNALAVVRDASRLTDYFSGDDLKGHVAATQRIKAELHRAGIDPSYGMPTIFPIKGNVVLLMFNHEYGVKPYDADAMTAAALHARREVHDMVCALRGLGGAWDGLQLISSAEQIGIREGRRLHGRYTVTQDDLVQGKQQPDAVTRVTFGVDIHALTREKNVRETIGRGGVVRMRPYDIPLRALIAKDVDGLMMAGRCISGDFVAHASYRVTGDAAAMGEAAGTVAALAARTHRFPHEVPWADVENALRVLRS